MAFATFFYYIHGSLILTKFKTMKKGKFAFLLIGMLFSVNIAFGQTTVTTNIDAIDSVMNVTMLEEIVVSSGVIDLAKVLSKVEVMVIQESH